MDILSICMSKSCRRGIYLATCDDIQGLVAQGRTIAETIEIARDIVGILIEAQRRDSVQTSLASPTVL